MQVICKYFPQDIIKRYHLDKLKTSDDYVYKRIKKGMYELKQAALLAYNNLKESLQPHGYTPIIGTVGMWEHKTRKIKFCLCVDNFRINYFNKEDVNHLIESITKTYDCTTN